MISSKVWQFICAERLHTFLTGYALLIFDTESMFTNGYFIVGESVDELFRKEGIAL